MYFYIYTYTRIHNIYIYIIDLNILFIYLLIYLFVFYSFIYLFIDFFMVWYHPYDDHLPFAALEDVSGIELRRFRRAGEERPLLRRRRCCSRGIGIGLPCSSWGPRKSPPFHHKRWPMHGPLIIIFCHGVFQHTRGACSMPMLTKPEDISMKTDTYSLSC